jgi:hypothetical protein
VCSVAQVGTLIIKQVVSPINHGAGASQAKNAQQPRDGVKLKAFDDGGQKHERGSNQGKPE